MCPKKKPAEPKKRPTELAVKPTYGSAQRHLASTSTSKSMAAEKKRPTFAKEVALRTRQHQSPLMIQKSNASIALRREFLQKQHVSNVQNELSRIQGIQDLHRNHHQPQRNIAALRARMRTLKLDLAQQQPIIGAQGQM